MSRQPTMGFVPGLLTALDVVTAATTVAQPSVTDRKAQVIDYTDLTPWDRVRIGNQLGMHHGLDPPLRMLGGYLLGKRKNILQVGSRVIAKWIRSRMNYYQEAPGVELLQGPYDSLTTKVVDCDDAAIMFLSITRAVGLPTYMVGVGSLQEPDILLHAVGYDAGTGEYYELIDDSAYGGRKDPLIFQLPEGYFGVYHTEEPGQEGFWVDLGDGAGPQKQTEESMRRFMGAAPDPKLDVSDPADTSGWFGLGEAVVEHGFGALGEIYGEPDIIYGPPTQYFGTTPPVTTEGYEYVPDRAPGVGISPWLLVGGAAVVGLAVYMLAK